LAKFGGDRDGDLPLRDKPRQNKKHFEVFHALAFIAAVTEPIPPKVFQIVRYYGWYSNRARGERKRLGLTKPGAEVE
jgi:hypothetical protein